MKKKKKYCLQLIIYIFAFALRVSPLLRLFRHSKVCLLTYYVTDVILITIIMALERKLNTGQLRKTVIALSGI